MESLVAHIARKERDRLRVVQVDVDERADLVQKLRVESVPTLVLVSNRKAVARLDGRASAPKIEAMLEEHLALAVGATRLRLKPRDHRERERGGARAVDDAVVERDADVPHRAHDDLAVDDDGARADAMDAEDRRPRDG